MLKFISKFVLNVFPSVAASVIGAYIVHSYIMTKPAEQAPAVAASTLASPAADDVDAPAMPIPVSAKAVAADAPTASRDKAASKITVATEEATAAMREKHGTVQLRNANAVARTASERLGVAHRGDRSAETAALRRERVHASAAVTPVVQPLPPAGPVLMPAVDWVPDAQAAESATEARIDTASNATHANPGRFVLSTETPLLKRLSSLSTEVETLIVSRTRAAADHVVTTAKSVVDTVLSR